jgi:hypothetical protein
MYYSKSAAAYLESYVGMPTGLDALKLKNKIALCNIWMEPCNGRNHRPNVMCGCRCHEWHTCHLTIQYDRVGLQQSPLSSYPPLRRSGYLNIIQSRDPWRVVLLAHVIPSISFKLSYLGFLEKYQVCSYMIFAMHGGDLRTKCSLFRC